MPLVLLLAHERTARGDQLFLEAVINGRSAGEPVEFVEQDGKLSATPDQLHRIGIAVPRGGPDDTPIPLDGLDGLRYRLDGPGQRILIQAEDRRRRPADLGGPGAPAALPAETSRGVLLNYDLLSTGVPADVAIGETAHLVRPRARSGTRVSFPVERQAAARIRLILAAGEPVPVGATAVLGGGQAVPVGHDGETFVSGLAAGNLLDVRLPGGGRCRATFAFAATAGDIPLIGPLPCR